jgi:hypothetical protein
MVVAAVVGLLVALEKYVGNQEGKVQSSNQEDFKRSNL